MNEVVQRVLIVPILFTLSSCTYKTPELSSFESSSATATPIAASFSRDGKGNVIKADGWQIPALPESRTYKETLLKSVDREVKGLMFWFTPKEKMMVTIPKYWEDGDVTYKVTSISELKGEKQPPYCYHFIVTPDWPEPANHPAVSTFFSYRDEDGDGIFETLGQGCAVPAWVE